LGRPGAYVKNTSYWKRCQARFEVLTAEAIHTGFLFFLFLLFYEHIETVDYIYIFTREGDEIGRECSTNGGD
jgi:hypothetical protein